MRFRTNRAVSPADSLGSNSAFVGKPMQPQTARQLAAAANKARKAERNDDSDEDSRDEDGELFCNSYRM
jgi:inhibitor of growth protein 3